MADTDPINIPVRFTIHDENVEAWEAEKRKGITMPVRAVSPEAAAGAPRAAAGSTPIPTAATTPVRGGATPIPGFDVATPAARAATYQAEINHAIATGDTVGAQKLAAQAAAMGMSVTVPPVGAVAPRVVPPTPPPPVVPSRAVPPAPPPPALPPTRAPTPAPAGGVLPGAPIVSIGAMGSAANVPTLQNAINAAWARGDTSATMQLVEQARGLGAAVEIPSAAARPGRGGGLMPGGFGPGGYMGPGGGAPMYTSPIGPPVPPGFKPPVPPRSFGARVGAALAPFNTIGNYMAVLFGGAEVAQQAMQIRLANVKASVAATDIERMNLQAQGAMPTGFTGAIISMGKDVLGLDSPARLTETITRETARRQSLDTVRENQFRRQNERALMGAVGQGEYQIGMEKARIQQAERHRAAALEYQNIRGALTATEPTTLRETMPSWAGAISPLGTWAAGSIKWGSRPALRDEGMKSAFQGRLTDLEQEVKVADAERAVTETHLQRQRFIAREETEGLRRTASFRRQNMQIETALSSAFTDVRKAVQTAAPQDRWKTLLAGAEGVGATIAEIGRGITTQNRATGGEIAQANIATRTIEAVSGFRLQNRPAEAERARIEGQRAAAMEAIERDRAQRVQDAGKGLWGILMRPGIEASAVARRGQANAALDAEQLEFDRQRTHMIEDITLNQGGRRRQLEALMRRDPTSATVEGILTQSREEENRMRRLGLPDKAEEALTLGQDQLRVLRQGYLDAFQGVQVSKDFALSLSAKDAEDPGTVLKNIEKGIDKLGVPGTVADWARPIVEAINNAVKDASVLFVN